MKFLKFLLLFTLLVFVQPMFADVDPGMVGTWEVSGVNAQGPWKLTWEIREDSSYSLSGLFSDSGIIGSGDGRWHIISNVSKQSADGTYTLRDANHMDGTGPLGAAAWTRVGDASAKATPEASSEWNPFEDVFGKAEKAASPATELSRAEKDDLWNDWLNSHNKDSRDRLEKKARSGIAMAQVLFGMYWWGEKNFDEAATWFRKGAEKGDHNGMYNLGKCYRDGEGVAKDPSQAMTWFRKAAELGNVDAPWCIGDLYSNGIGVAKDDVAAAEWYRKGAVRGDKQAMNTLGARYWSGSGVENSAREAITWWKQAAEKGDENAKKNLEMALKKFDESGQPRSRE